MGASYQSHRQTPCKAWGEALSERAAGAKDAFDVVITGGAALVGEAGDGASLIKDAFIGVRADKIAKLCPLAMLADVPYEAKLKIDARGMLVIPGLVNTHSHAAMVFLRGLADDLPLNEWLFQHILPMEKRLLDAQLVYHAAKLAFAEMLLAGITTVADSYFYEAATAQAAAELGVRLVLSRGYFDPPDLSAAGINALTSSAAKFLARWRNVSPLITPALFAHALYTCSPSVIGALKAVARANNAQFMLHLLETSDENDIVRAKHGATPLEILLAHDILDEKTLAVHCTHLDDEAIALFAERSVKVSHNPKSNMKLASGVTPLTKLLQAGVCVGLGTDGAASNNRLDLFSEMDVMAKLHKAASLDATVIKAATALRMATIDGARALGWGGLLGSLEVGKQADIVLVDFAKPHLTPVYDYISHLVYCAKPGDVHTTIVAGKPIVLGGILQTADVGEVIGAINSLRGKCR